MRLKKLAGLIALTGIVGFTLYACDDSTREMEIQRVRALEKNVSTKEWGRFASEQERIFADFNINTQSSKGKRTISEKELFVRLENNCIRVLNDMEIDEDTTECQETGGGGGIGGDDDSTFVAELSSTESKIAYVRQHSTNRYADIFTQFLQSGKLSVTKSQVIKDPEMLNIEKARLLSIMAFLKNVHYSPSTLGLPERGSCLDDYEAKINACAIQATAIIGIGCLTSSGLGVGAAAAIATIYYENCANIADKEYQECIKSKEQ